MHRILPSLLTILLLLAQPARVSADDLEYQVKAAFLFNFLKFVEWPASSGEGPWVIGVLGRDPFGDALTRTVSGKTVSGRPVEVRRFTRPADVKDCHILFISRQEFERSGTVVHPNMLTVGESPGFLKAGGIINFYLEENRVHLEIRPEVAQAAGLRVSAQLRKLGRPQ